MYPPRGPFWVSAGSLLRFVVQKTPEVQACNPKRTRSARRPQHSGSDQSFGNHKNPHAGKKLSIYEDIVLVLLYLSIYWPQGKPMCTSTREFSIRSELRKSQKRYCISTTLSIHLSIYVSIDQSIYLSTLHTDAPSLGRSLVSYANPNIKIC